MSSEKRRVETTMKFFLKEGQKFQIVDAFSTVVVELCGNTYTLYDTLPQTEWDNMKQAIALFHTFRVFAKRLIGF